jgi:hypothetical protein
MLVGARKVTDQNGLRSDLSTEPNFSVRTEKLAKLVGLTQAQTTFISVLRDLPSRALATRRTMIAYRSHLTEQAFTPARTGRSQYPTIYQHGPPIPAAKNLRRPTKKGSNPEGRSPL